MLSPLHNKYFFFRTLCSFSVLNISTVIYMVANHQSIVNLILINFTLSFMYRKYGYSLLQNMKFKWIIYAHKNLAFPILRKFYYGNKCMKVDSRMDE